jgi:hypothetical protein
MSTPPRRSPRVAFLFALLAVPLVAFAAPALAYDDERASLPADGSVVGGEVHFYIEASGGPEVEEFYRIEVAEDPDFEYVVTEHDSRDKKAGWAFGTMRGMSLEEVPEQYRPVSFEGIHYRGRTRLDDGEYYWRASKAIGGGEWEPIDGENRFVVDTTPPEDVPDLRVDKREDGELVLSWGTVGYDVSGNSERVVGFRVYQYTKLLRMYRPLTRYIVGEVPGNDLEVDTSNLEQSRIVFFRVQAVDDVGNEQGRRRAKPFGEWQEAREITPPDKLTDPAYLRRLAREEQ